MAPLLTVFPQQKSTTIGCGASICRGVVCFAHGHTDVAVPDLVGDVCPAAVFATAFDTLGCC